MIGRNTEIDEFQALVCAINEKLGPSSGIDSADVDENELQELMQAYTSNESEWKKYFFASDKIPYTRNVVDKGNGKSNLLVLVWGPGKKSPIHDTHRLFLDLPEDPEDPERTIIVHGLSLLHDEATVFADLLIVASVQKTCRHANAHCIMKVLKGRLTETRFATPTESDIQNQRPMTKIRETTYSENEVTYMADSLGVHRISNPDSTDYAVSLHLYTPPNAATYGCNVFNEENSGLIHIKQCHFYSEYGIKIERD